MNEQDGKFERPGRVGKQVLWLPCKLREDEVREAGKTLAESLRRRDEIEEGRTAINKKMKAEIAEVEGTIASTQDKVASETEYRHVECEVRYFFGRGRGEKDFIRTDTGELVRTENVTDEDRQTKLE